MADLQTPVRCAMTESMESNQFEVLMLAITGLDTKLITKIDAVAANINTKIDAVAANLNTKIDAFASDIILVREDIEIIRTQTAATLEEVSDLKSRVSKLEGPHA